jgi:hypothetical protein
LLRGFHEVRNARTDPAKRRPRGQLLAGRDERHLVAVAVCLSDVTHCQSPSGPSDSWNNVAFAARPQFVEIRYKRGSRAVALI